MKLTRLRNKLLWSALTIALLVALASMLAVLWVINGQYLAQSQAVLNRATNIVNDHLHDIRQDLLAASRQLAGEKNLGSTLWYLAQYERAGLTRETLFLTYQQLARDTQKIGQIAKATHVSLYDADGNLISFGLFKAGTVQLGFVEHEPKPVFQVASLNTGEELNRKNLRRVQSLPNTSFRFKGKLPTRETVTYAVLDGLLAIESLVPITGEVFDPKSGRMMFKQLGLVVMAQSLDQDFTQHLSHLTDTRINISTEENFCSGVDETPGQDDTVSPQSMGITLPATALFNETTLAGEDFDQALIPLYTDGKLVGIISALHSKTIVRDNIREMMLTLALIALFSLLFILPFAWYFANSISRPIKSLSRLFRSVAAGRHGGELAELKQVQKRHDELGDLSQSFIAMNDAVNQKIRQINEINASLEHKIAERTAALAASERDLRSLVENSPDTIARYDRHCRRIYVNPAFAALAAGGEEALLGKTPMEFPGGDNMEIYEAQIGKVFASGEDAQFELKWRGKNGQEICSHIRLTAERDESGNVVSVLGVGRDITELNDYRTELKRKGLAQTRFLAAAGHDLRQPIHAQGLFLDVLAHTGLNRRQRKLLDHISAASTATAEMINTLLDFSRIEAGAIEPQIKPFRLQPLLNKIEREFEQQADAKGLAYRSRETALVLKSDPMLVELILRNLVSNAIRYTTTGGVLVAARRRGDTALLEVWDSGIGISPEYQHIVFLEFHQLNNPERDRKKGLGLGLSIADGLAKMLGHKLTLASRPGRGSVFRLSLPLTRETPLEKSGLPALKTQTLNARVLVVEDDEAVRTGMRHLLGDWGCECLAVESIQDALAEATSFNPHAVISDYRLREQQTGIEAIAALRILLGSHLPALLITGDTAPERLREAQASDIELLHKPISPDQLYLGLVKALKTPPNKN